jgi:hypothetical protein
MLLFIHVAARLIGRANARMRVSKLAYVLDAESACSEWNVREQPLTCKRAGWLRIVDDRLSKFTLCVACCAVYCTTTRVRKQQLIFHSSNRQRQLTEPTRFLFFRKGDPMPLHGSTTTRSTPGSIKALFHTLASCTAARPVVRALSMRTTTILRVHMGTDTPSSCTW